MKSSQQANKRDMRTSKVVIPKELAQSIETMREQLIGFAGQDFAFTVCVRGKIVAASNLTNGVVYADY